VPNGIRIVATARYIDVAAQNRGQRASTTHDRERFIETGMPTPPNEAPNLSLAAEEMNDLAPQLTPITPRPEMPAGDNVSDREGVLPDSLAPIPPPAMYSWDHSNYVYPASTSSTSIPLHYHIPQLSSQTDGHYESNFTFEGTNLPEQPSEVTRTGGEVTAMGNEWMFQPNPPYGS